MNAKQHDIATLIHDHCKWEGDCTDNPLLRYWCPSDKNDYSETLQRTIWVDGAGFVSSLKTLERKGWIRFEKASRYCASITEAGINAIEEFRESHGLYANGKFDHQASSCL